MPLLPSDPWSLVALGLILGGVGVIVFARVPKALSLGLLCLAVFFIQFIVRTGPSGEDTVAENLGLSLSALKAGAWWTPLTYMFIHADFISHLLGNLVILLTAGPALEDRIGERRFLVIYFAAGFAAVAVQLVLANGHILGIAPGDLAIGASGAIFGVLTAFAVRYPRARLPLFLFFFVLPGVPALFILALFLLLNVALALTGGQGVAWYAHFAGFAAGLAFALTLPRESQLRTGGGPKAMPDIEKLRPFATTPALVEMLEKIAQFDGAHPNDREFADAWVDKFLAKARCPTHRDLALERVGSHEARCPRGDYVVDFGR